MTRMSPSELIAEGRKALSYGLNDYADPYTLVGDLTAALEEAEKMRRLHSIATQKVADVRTARDRAEARFAARGDGLSILADFYAAVGDVLTVEESNDE